MAGLQSPARVLQCLTHEHANHSHPRPLAPRAGKALPPEKSALSDVVRDSLRRYVAAQRFQALRKKTLPFAEAQGFLSDEDVFKAIS